MLRSGSAPTLPTETTPIDRATSASRLRIGVGRASTHQREAHPEGGAEASPCEAYAALIEETFDDLLDEVDLTEEWKLIKEELGVKVSKKTLAENGSVLPPSSSSSSPKRPRWWELGTGPSSGELGGSQSARNFFVPRSSSSSAVPDFRRCAATDRRAPK